MLTGDKLLTPAEVGELYRVDPKTVSRWGASGRLPCIRTPGGHRRFKESQVRALLEGDTGDQAAAVPAPRSGAHDQEPVAAGDVSGG
ncbi:BldC family transcriptional regulator [Micromonospora tulbaghiae]|uniref:BldC family transcriptional regulator n=1 Tax=Micromonospora tulbaghiae TaxID=479978 RepID=UPI00332728E4